jgi:BRCA1-associated protein
MDVVSQHVWDYAGDGYVHRLIQNKADGKLVDLPASTHPNTTSAFAPHNNMTGYANDTVPREKVDNMGMEYAYLLTSQLESQRRFFEEQVERAADKAAKAASSADAAQRSVSDVSRQLATLKTAYSEAQASIALLEKESARSKTRAETSTELARKLSKQVKEEQTINESLMTRIAFLEKRAGDAETKVKEVEEQKKELEEQNRDLSFFISGQERLREMERKGEERGGLGEGELQSAVMEVGEAAEEKGMGKGKRKGKGRKK